MRLDKLLSELKYATRKQCKRYAKEGLILVDNKVCKDASKHVDPTVQSIHFNGEEIVYHKTIYLMMNKPKGVICALSDDKHPTVSEIVFPKVRQTVFPVGRLDKDTTGLLLLTNDGDFSHKVIHNKQGIMKTYRAKIAHQLSIDDIDLLCHGLSLDGELLRRAEVVVEDETTILVSISEGKYHQVKRMLHAVNNEVLQLERIRIGELYLDERLNYGEFRMLTKEEFKLIGVDVC